MKRRLLIAGQCYFRTPDTKRISTCPYSVTVEIEVPNSEPGVISYIQNKFLNPYFLKNPPVPGYINWQTCRVEELEVLRLPEPKITKPVLKSKKVVIE